MSQLCMTMIWHIWGLLVMSLYGQNKLSFVHSAEDEVYGKPHPAAFLTVADALKVDPKDCLVLEDSFNGVLAGKSAKMHVVCIPEKSHKPDARLMIADYHFETMSDMLHDLKISEIKAI